MFCCKSGASELVSLLFSLVDVRSDDDTDKEGSHAAEVLVCSIEDDSKDFMSAADMP